MLTLIKVAFGNGRNTFSSTHYDFLADFEVEKGDTVLVPVNCKVKQAVGIVQSVHPIENHPARATKLAYKKLKDAPKNYDERVQRAAELRELIKKIHDRKKVVQSQMLERQLAALDPALAEMIARLDALTAPKEA